jgi:uncharacterized protein YjdB
MFVRSPWKLLLLVGFALTLAGCTNNLVDSIVIAPSTQTLAVGQTVQFTATGYQSHGTHPSTSEIVTNQCAWSSSAPSIVTISSTGLATAVSAGTATIGASMQGFGGVIGNTALVTVTASGSVSAEPLASMAIDPGSQTALAVNQTLNFIAIGTTGSGATVNLTGQSATVGSSTIKAATWASSNPAIASVNPSTGIATALTSGTTTITAQAVNPDGTVVIGNATLTVTLASASPEPLVSMALIPGTQTLTSANQPADFIAIGTTGTGTTVNLTNKVVWSSSSPTVASIGASTGVAAALSNGTTAITAVATNPDGTVVTGVGSVTVNISASAEPIVSLAIVPSSQTASVIGQTAQFIAIGTTSAGTTVNLTNETATVGTSTINAAVWGSSSTTVATINAATGLAKSVAPGTVAITAQAKNPDGSVVTGTATFTVSATAEPLVSLAIVPGSQTLAGAGQPAQFIAIGTTSSGATVNLTNTTATIGAVTINAATWGSSSMSVATINQAGLATAGVTGTTAITAIAYNPDGTAVTGSATLTVTSSATPEPLVSLAIVPASQTAFAINQTANFIAVGTTSSGATVNLTNVSATVGSSVIAAATWTSSNPAVASVNPATGVAQALSAGTAAITAIATNPDGTVVTGSASYTVTVPSVAEPLVSMAITPSSATLAQLNQTLQLTATATTGTGTTVDLTGQSATIGTATILPAVFTSSVPGVATVSPGGGLVTPLTPGTTVITAIASNPDNTVVTGVSTVTVTATGGIGGSISSISIIPGTQAVPAPNATAQYIAIGTTTTGATVNLTNQVAWSSSSAQIGTIGANTGLATGVGQGSATITALYTPPAPGSVITGTAQFAVNGGTTETYTGVTLIPNALSLSVGQTSQFIALGTLGTSGLIVDVTDSPQITWSSDAVSLAIINSTGLVTGVNTGNSTITVELKNPDGTLVSSTASVTVTTTTAPEPLVSLTIIPNSLTVGNLQATGQFLAIGTFSTAPFVRDLTNAPTTTWISSFPDYFPVDTNSGGTPSATAGIVTAYEAGSATIIAEAANPDGTIQTATAIFNCPLQLPSPDSIPPLAGTCYTGQVGPLKATLTIYGEGLETNDTWLVTASSATNTPDVIHCGPGYAGDGVPSGSGSVCVAIYPVNQTVLLTATQAPSTTGTFGGWTYNCTPSDVNGNPLPGPIFWTADGPNYCTIPLGGTNATVGAIFN